MSNAPHDKLARWLSEPSTGVPAPAPEGLEPDVVEAVYALRPDLAPPPRVDIDDILAELTEGPLAQTPEERAAEARAAAAFAALLDSPAGADFDDDELDAAAVESLLALQPDRAPAPRVDIDDIFGAITEGPFAQPDNVVALPTAAAALPPAAAAADEEPEAADEPAAEVVDLSTRRRSWWALPGLGALAAAAAALMVVQPMSLNESQPLDMALDNARYAPAPVSASAPMEQEGELDPLSAKSRAANGARSDTPSDVDANLERKPADEPAAGNEPTDALAGAASDLPNVAAAKPAMNRAPEPALEPEPVPEPEPESEPEIAAVTETAPRQQPAPSAGAEAPAPTGATTGTQKQKEEANEIRDQLAALGYVDSSVGVVGGATGGEDAGAERTFSEDADMFDESDLALEGTVEEAGVYGEAYAYDESEAQISSGRSVEIFRPGRRNSGLFGGDRGTAASAPQAEPAEPMAAPESESFADDDASADVFEVEEEEAVEELPLRPDASGDAAPVTMTVLRTRAARAFDGVPSVPEANTELASVYAEVDAFAAAGDVSGALERLDGLRRSSDPDVALDVAWRRCDLYLRRGLVVPAIAALDEGLQVVGGDSRLRARVLYQKGQLLERRGDVAGATAAYQEAARLR